MLLCLSVLQLSFGIDTDNRDDYFLTPSTLGVLQAMSFQQRDQIASMELGKSIGHTAAGLVRVDLRKVFDGYLYWSIDALLFIADNNIFTDGNLLKLEFSDLGPPKSKFVLWNGELDFGNGKWIFHGQKRQMKELEQACLRHGKLKK